MCTFLLEQKGTRSMFKAFALSHYSVTIEQDLKRTLVGVVYKQYTLQACFFTCKDWAGNLMW